ncbi:MAG: BlaI/MecI/CopY family transcriptional regulator [Chloroflexia bacterium]|nr:BlaI/MecI/CopY family transcriptional regulator [Chloroflexia bacterium]
MDFHRFKLDQSGLARVLGTLEARIMEGVWTLGSPTIRELCEILEAPPHYKTVLTVANRMVEKGLLARAPTPDRAFSYRATESRNELVRRLSSSVATELVGDFGHHALAQFVDAAERLDPAYLDELERLVRERKGV